MVGRESKMIERGRRSVAKGKKIQGGGGGKGGRVRDGKGNDEKKRGKVRVREREGKKEIDASKGG